jgi:hypothetical protein
MSDWFHDLPLVWMAVLVFGLTYDRSEAVVAVHQGDSGQILYLVLREIPKSLHSSAIDSPASRRATNCSFSSITEHSLHGIPHLLPKRRESVTYVWSTMCHLCVRSLKNQALERLACCSFKTQPALSVSCTQSEGRV